MTLVDWLIGAGAGIAVLLAITTYIASVVLRERRGSQSRLVTLSTSRPVLTGTLMLLACIGVMLLVLRLGVLS